METEGSGLKIKLRLGGNIIKPQTTSVAAAAVAPPREKKKRKVPVHERVEKEEDDVHMMEKQAEAPDESPSPTSGERQAVRRSQRRRTGRNKYVLYDNLNDEDYFLEIEKQIETKLDFVSTIMDNKFEDPAEIMDVYQTGKEVRYGNLFKKKGFRRPILVKDASGLGMKLPSDKDFDIDSVAALVGNRELDVIDVTNQSELRPPWKMEDWVQYFNQPAEQRERVLNVISLEFSDTKLASKVRAPKFVRKADWVDIVWPRELKERALRPENPPAPTTTTTPAETVTQQKEGADTDHEGEPKESPGQEKNSSVNGHHEVPPETHTTTTTTTTTSTSASDQQLRAYYPKVQLYCLMSVKGSYTDFHIDFGGSSVWYHVLWGKKIFFMIPPTQANLKRYEKWATSPSQGAIFLANKA